MEETGRFKLGDSAKFRASFQDVTPVQAFYETISKVRESLRRSPTRVKTKVRCAIPVKGGRYLSWQEIARIESDMIAAGINIKRKFGKKGVESMKQHTDVEKRVSNFFSIISCFVEEKGHFTLGMLDSAAKEKITNNKAYFRRTVYSDLKKLVDAGLIYQRGNRPVVYYLGDGRVEGPKSKKVRDLAKETEEPSRVWPLIPEHITITLDINLKLG